jgi:hypothetical protein
MASWAKLAACRLLLVSWLAHSLTLKMELTCSSKMSGSLWNHYNREDRALLYLLVDMLVFLFIPVRVHPSTCSFQCLLYCPINSVVCGIIVVINSSLVSQSERTFCPHEMHLVNSQNLGTQMFNFYYMRVLYIDIITCDRRLNGK